MDTSIANIIACFMVLFAVIDITGSIPLIIDLKQKDGEIYPLKATIVAGTIIFMFFFIGEPLLSIFGIDVSSFAIAGAIILFLMAVEMVLGIELFKYESTGTSSIVPIAFPLIAGAGSITTIISLKAEYTNSTIIIALALNLIFVYIVLRATSTFEKFLGPTGIVILRKFFGVILLAIAIKLFLSNTGFVLPI